MFNVGIVIIGKNEGERLIRCIQSLTEYLAQVVYVDSASTDGSLQAAKRLGVHTISLDMTMPFTAARARNAGFSKVIELFPTIELVQFVDGDCELLSGWPSAGIDFLNANQHIAVVSGVLFERFPNKSIYNTLCDIEWKLPIGEVKACGGNALMRVSAFKAASGFMSNLTAGEEPELCLRLRRQGWKIWHINVPMMLHDANMIRFNEWWTRTTRAGYAYAEGAYLHGTSPERHWVAESKRAWLWGFFIPLIIFLFIFIKPVMGMLLLAVYPVQVLRLFLQCKQPFKIACAKAFFLMLGKFAEFAGQVKFLWHLFNGK